MKKRSKITLALLMTLPMFIKADMGAPYIEAYNVYVTNPNGAKVTCDNNKEITIPYETKLENVFEDYEAGYDHIEVSYDGNNGCIISVSDIEREKTNSDDSKITTLKTAQSLIVSNQNGIQMYKGPSIAYGKENQTIPYLTKLESSKVLYGAEGMLKWYYVSYNNVNGWVVCLDSNIGELKSTNKEIETTIEMKILNNEVIEIKKSSVVDEVYKLDAWSEAETGRGYFIKYNNQYGTSMFYEELEEEMTYTTTKELKMYNLRECTELEDASENSTCKLITTIPKNTELKFSLGYIFNNWGYGYLTYNNNEGWVYMENLDGSDYDSYDDTTQNETTSETGEVNTTSDNTQQTTNNENKKLSTKDYIYLCVGAAVIISVTALVTILLMNKKKKKEVPTSEPTTSAPVAPTEPTPVQPEEPKQDNTTK